MSEAIALLGKLLDDHAERDAIHIAVAPVMANETLYPGQQIGFVGEGQRERVGSARPNQGLGIVDPFLPAPVYPGQRFWMFLTPQTITGLRHVWTHPAWPEVPVPVDTSELREKSEAWLRDFAKGWGMDYDEMIELASNPAEEWTYIVARRMDLHGADELGEDYETFWQHLCILTGRTFDAEHRGKVGWSCSC